VGRTAFLKPVLSCLRCKQSLVRVQRLKAPMRITFASLDFHIALNTDTKHILPLPWPSTRFIHCWPKSSLLSFACASNSRGVHHCPPLTGAPKLRCHLTKPAQSVNRFSSARVRIKKKKKSQLDNTVVCPKSILRLKANFYFLIHFLYNFNYT
jgi:hypothetical protein